MGRQIMEGVAVGRGVPMAQVGAIGWWLKVEAHIGPQHETP